MKKRVFVLGIDGVPYSLIEKMFKENKLQNLHEICKQGSYHRMNSVYPTISSVAWTSYATGTNPAEHSIFGFIDRRPSPFSIFIPLSTDRKSDSLWKILSEKGKRVIVINVPLTYPPEEVNGILASGFLCPDIDKLSYPAGYNKYFKSKNYIIDVDAWLARENKRKFISEIFKALDKRFELAFELMRKEKWDFFQLHIMETDRLLHFFWSDIEDGGEFREDTDKFFEILDNYIGELQHRLNRKDSLLILSDHGFCKVKYEVQLNIWLEQIGLLKFDSVREKKLPDYHYESVCYSLIPGRIYINLEGREAKGSIKREKYEETREMIKERLLEFKHPETGERIIDKVFYREEIYSGPYLENAADIIAHPVNGYDLKARLDTDNLFENTALNGMHTYDDAFICGYNIKIDDIYNIEDVRKNILSIF